MWSIFCARLVLVAFVLIAGVRFAQAEDIVAWNWNDGTTQGWEASTAVSNSGNRLLATNSGNGSLQIFSPYLTGSARDWSNFSEIRLDVEIASYSGIGSPSEFTRAEIGIFNRVPGVGALIWDLDVTGWKFGETRTFVVPVSQPGRLIGGLTREQMLQNVDFVSLLFTKNFEQNTSSAYLDNFVVRSTASSAIPEPSTLALAATGLLPLAGAVARKRRRSA